MSTKPGTQANGTIGTESAGAAGEKFEARKGARSRREATPAPDTSAHYLATISSCGAGSAAVPDLQRYRQRNLPLLRRLWVFYE